MELNLTHKKSSNENTVRIKEKKLVEAKPNDFEAGVTITFGTDKTAKLGDIAKGISDGIGRIWSIAGAVGGTI